MGSTDLTAGVETPEEVFDPVVETSNRLFTGNSAIDAGAAGAALGAAAQFFGNQILNPCRGGNRGGTTNTRLVNGETLQNGALGFLAGFAGSSLINNALGNPCGK